MLSAPHQTKPRRAERLVLIACIAVVALAALTLSPAATRASRWVCDSIPGFDGISRRLNPFRTRHALLGCGLPVYDIRIKAGEYRKIRAAVDQAVAQGELTDDLKTWARAVFVHAGVIRNAKIRVRGDLPIHWEGPRKSWRIKLNKETPLEGIREFNLILLSDSKGLQERFTNAVYRKLGLLTLRDKYAVLRINGAMQGVYYQVEHVAAPLLAHHQRPEGAVFGNPRYGLETASFKEQITDDNQAAWLALQSLLDYELQPTEENLQRAIGVTDMEDYLRFAAGTTLFCSDHSNFASDNHKLYFDASRGLFYRIPWDIRPLPIPRVYAFEFGDKDAAFDFFRFEPMSKMRIAAITRPEYRLRRDRILWSLVKDDGLLETFDEAYDGLDAALWADVMGAGDEVDRLRRFRRLVVENAEHIRRSLSVNQAEARFRKEQGLLATLQLSANSLSGLLLRGVALQSDHADTPDARTYTLYRDNNTNEVLDQGDTLVASATADSNGKTTFADLNEMLLPDQRVLHNHSAYFHSKPVRTAVLPTTGRRQYLLTWTAGDPQTQSMPAIHLDVINAVTKAPYRGDELRLRSVRPEPTFDPLRRLATRSSFLKAHAQFTAAPDAEAGITLTRGVHRFDRTVVVPERVPLRIEAGATLRMGPGVSIVSHAGLEACGTLDAPIVVEPIGKESWGTLAVVRAEQPCVISHLHLTGGAGGMVDGVRFSGALSIHDSSLTLTDSRVTDCRGEDGVNVKNGSVVIEDTYFADQPSDALDLDFVTGSIRRCHFERIQGDAIDFCGSRFRVSKCRIEDTGDKGVSIGEASDIDISNTLIRRCATGIAVKDRSKARIEHCTLIGAKTAIAVYRKKPIFGGAIAHVRRCVLGLNEATLTHDRFSEIQVTACFGSADVGPWTPSVSSTAWYQQLRSRNFVLNDHLIADAGGSNDDPRPGLVAAPIDLR